MNTEIRNRLLWIGLPLVALVCGCGNYQITFEAADVINASSTDMSRQALDVDILCLTKEDVDNHPEIVNGTMRASEWFKARQQDDPRIGDIDPSRIYALRYGESGDRRDTWVGPPLLSFIDREDRQRTTTVRVHHPGYLHGQAAIVIFARFLGPTDVANTPPLVIQPPPRWDSNIRIKVGRTNMSRVH